MPTKLGVNDLCWCGSTRKYKKCHRNREFEKPMPFEAMAEVLRQSSVQKRCLHPSASIGVCDKIISAHTIQRSGVLQRLVDSSNHVRTFYPPETDDSGTGLRLHRVGWRQASTFTGFCAKHDNLVFRPLEVSDFDASVEQCFLVGYRALCHEIHQKLGILKADPAIRTLVDRGVPVAAQREIQEMWASMEEGTQRGLQDFQKLKAIMDEQLLSGHYSGWSRAVVRFRGDLCVASTGAVSPNVDFDARQLQLLDDRDTDIEELPFGIVATPEGGAAVFVWRSGAKAPETFVESLLKKEKSRLPGLIVQFMFAYIENTYFSDHWWGTLPLMHPARLGSLAGIGNPYDTEFSYSYAKYVPWEVTGVFADGT